MEKFQLHIVDACEYGSQHKKATAFLANFKASRLLQRCRGDHEHAAWKIKKLDNGDWSFDTAKVAEYPLKLARELAAAFIDELQSRGDVQLQESLSKFQQKHSRGGHEDLFFFLSSKPRFAFLANRERNRPASFPTMQSPLQGIPVGSKRLDVQPVFDDKKGGSGPSAGDIWGIFSPSEFIQRVQGIRHPFDIPLPLDEANMSAISFLLENGPAKVAEHRAARSSGIT